MWKIASIFLLERCLISVNFSIACINKKMRQPRSQRNRKIIHFSLDLQLILMWWQVDILIYSSRSVPYLDVVVRGHSHSFLFRSVPYLDVVVGGHSHSFLFRSVPYLDVVVGGHSHSFLFRSVPYLDVVVGGHSYFFLQICALS